MTQPVLWGHGFINPKDTPFATAFIAAVYFGFRWVNQLSSSEFDPRKSLPVMLTTGVLIGLAINMRIIGPLLLVMLIIYAVLKGQKKSLLWFIPLTGIGLAC